MHLELNINELFEVFVLSLRLFLHEFRKSLSLYVLRNNHELSAVENDLKHLRNLQSGLLSSRLIERLVQNVSLRIVIRVEHLHAAFAVAVHRFIVSYGNNSVKIHFRKIPFILTRPAACLSAF